MLTLVNKEFKGAELARSASSFYIHWPFCPYRCHFCPFVALAGHDEYMEEYHEVLVKEIENYCDEHEPVLLKTIFFGGGTPSTYPPQLLAHTVELLKKRCGFDDQYELTIEVNPGTVDEQKLLAWKAMGVTRLSIGVQSLNDEVLKKLNRHQRADDVRWLLTNAAPLFKDLSVDLIVGLPGIAPDEWKSMIAEIVTWPITHVSMYFLTVHEDTQLYFGVQQNKIQLPADDDVVDLYYWTIDQFAKNGLEQYEVSNFAIPGWESRHNSVYWKREPYKAFGLGACSFDGTSRFQNEKNLLKYINGAENNGNITVFTEKLTDKQAWLEQLMLGLRQLKGVLIPEILKPLSDEEKKEFNNRVDELVAAKLLSVTDERIAITPHGRSVTNGIVVKLSCKEQ